MKIVIFQLITVLAMLLCTIYEWYVLGIKKNTNIEEDGGETIWTMVAERTGTAKWRLRQKLLKKKTLSTSINLGEGSYIVGNLFFNDIYIDSTGPPVKLYLNIQKNKVYLTILRGYVAIDNYVCHADETNRIKIPEYSSIRIADMKVQFIRKKVN